MRTRMTNEASECLSLSLRRAARTVSRRYDEALAPVDLNNGQFSMMALVAGLGRARIQKLADLLAMDRTTVTAALKPLERRALVRIDVSQDDARVHEASLTEAGEALLRRAVPLWQAQQDVTESALSAEEAQVLREQLRRLL